MGAFEFTGKQPPPPCPIQIPLRIDGTSLRDRSGAASVKLTCGQVAAHCDGKLTLTSRGKHRVALGSAQFSLSRGKSKSIKVRLSHKGLRKLDRRGKRETLRISIMAQLRHGITLTANGTLRVPRR
jgi:ribosomal protein L28